MLRRCVCGPLGLALVGLVASACASSRGPLTSEKVGQAERALDEARQAGAAIHAPSELKVAVDRLKEAKAAAAKKQYDRAMRTAEQAAADADYARARATNQRAKTMADEMRQGLGTLRKELER